MDYKEVMKFLQEMGTAQNRKVYKKHGAGEKLYGVSFANLKKLQKRIKIDHKLAEKLWASENIDARTLALLIANPKTFTTSQANNWIKEINYNLLISYLAALVAQTSFAVPKMEQ